MIKAIIVDDEIQGRRLLQALIETHCPQIEIVDITVDLPHAVKSIRKNKPELVFLDIEMPGHSGLEIAEFFSAEETTFSIIFTTAYAEYALQGYKLDAVDYLLKPIDSEELVQAVSRFEQRNRGSSGFRTLEVQRETIAIPVGQSIKFFEINNILYLKAINSYTEIYFVNGSKILVSRTLKNFEDAFLEVKTMVRCHKSYMVNRKFVVDYVKSEGGFIVLSDKTTVPLSPDKVQEFLSGAIFIKRQ